LLAPSYGHGHGQDVGGSAKDRGLVTPERKNLLVRIATAVVGLPVVFTGTLGGFPCPPAMVRGWQSQPAPHANDAGSGG